MSFELRFSERAVQDIEDVLAHTLEDFGERQYEEYKALIREALEDVAADPNLPTARRRPELHPQARTLHIGRRGRNASHFLLYRVVGREFVDIGRLLHEAMDLRKHLPKGYGAADA